MEQVPRSAAIDNHMYGPLDLTKVRLQASGDHGTLQFTRKTFSTTSEHDQVINERVSRSMAGY